MDETQQSSVPGNAGDAGTSLENAGPQPGAVRPNRDRKIAIRLSLVSVGLAVLATAIGILFFRDEDGGPAPYLGAFAFLVFIGSMIFLKRAKQFEQGQQRTSLITSSRNLILALVLLPVYLYGSFLFLWVLVFPLGLIPILAGFVGLIALVFGRYAWAASGLGLFALAGVISLLLQ